MPAAEDRRERLMLRAVPLALLVGLGARALPGAMLGHLLTILTIWTCASVPLAVLIGHCALSEE